jgi:hypothetical protein
MLACSLSRGERVGVRGVRVGVRGVSVSRILSPLTRHASRADLSPQGRGEEREPGLDDEEM